MHALHRGVYGNPERFGNLFVRVPFEAEFEREPVVVRERIYFAGGGRERIPTFCQSGDIRTGVF